MPIVSSDKPCTPRDHEILALANLISRTCERQPGLVMMAALAQLLLVILQRAEKEAGGITLEYDALAVLLHQITQDIRDLPQDTVQ